MPIYVLLEYCKGLLLSVKRVEVLLLPTVVNSLLEL